MAKKMVKGKDKETSSNEGDGKLFAFLAVLLGIIGFIIAYAVKKDDKYVMFYAKQSLVLFIAWVVLWIVGMVLGMIPFMGFVMWLLYIGLAVLWVFGLVYSLSGKMKDIPIVGDFARKFNF